MKKSNIIKSLTTALVVLLSGSFALTGCSTDDSTSAPTVKEGVVFSFKRKVVYATGVDQFSSVKITVSDGTKKIVLPSSRLKGDEDLVRTSAFALPAGNYELVGYTAYDKRQSPLFEIELDSLNEFKVEPAAIASFTVPVKVRQIMDQSPIRNALLGICKVVFGDDESTWPWDPEKYPYPDWDGLEFEFDDYDNPMYITGVCFNGSKNGEVTPWAQMTALPDGTIANMGTIQSLVFNDLPLFKSLPSDLEQMVNLNVLTITNTALEELPANLSALTKLHSLTVNNSQIKQGPAGLSALTDLRSLELRGNELTTWNVSLSQLNKLEALDLSYNPISSIADGTLPASGKLVRLELNHTGISSLPSEIASMSRLRGVALTGCQFTSIPASVKGNTGILELYLGQNPLSISATDFANLRELEVLELAGSKMTSLPKLTLPKLLMLDVAGCGLTSTPDLSAMPELRMLYIGNNDFATLPANYFAANTKMRILSLANSEKLTSMPSGNLGLVSKISNTEEGFKFLNVENCPALTWTTPAAWLCHDATNDIYDPKLLQTRRPDDPGGSIYDEYFGRVMVNRKGSPNVTFGK